MGLEKTIANACTQTAVYWANPLDDGSGGKTFDTAIEIQVRWENKTQVLLTNMSEKVTSNSRVYTLQDIDELGYLYLGLLSELSTEEKANPKLIRASYSVIKFDKIPTLFGNQYVRIAYL